MGSWGVYSEVGQLRSVMVHQPGWEHTRMLPWNREAMLFDDIIDLDVARGEHKEFVHKLANQGVEVLYFSDLLKDLCANPKRHEEIVREVIGESVLGDIDPMQIQPTHLITGYPQVDDFETPTLFEPILDLYFLRDPAFFVCDKLIISSPYYPIRRRESLLQRAVFSRHPKFKSVDVYDGILMDPEATIEGGDVLVVDHKTVLVGISERTNEAGAEHLARYLFDNTTVNRLVKICIPKKHEFMHLDTLMTFVDRQQIITLPFFWDKPEIYAEIARRVKIQCEQLGSRYYGPDPEDLAVGCSMEVVRSTGERKKYKNTLEGLAEEEIIVPEITVHVGGPKILFETPEEHVKQALREQWNDAANTFALKPGTVVSYSRNLQSRQSLENALVEVILFIGGELVRGRGGARCMTMPLKREPIYDF